MKSLFKVIYTPEGGSPREWTIDLANPAWDLTYTTEKATDWPWATVRQRLGNESAIALQALLWALRKRDEPRLALDSVRPDMDEIDYEATCPQCGEWITAEDVDGHECPVADVEQPQEGEPHPEA
jgi:hypothetical protein